MQNLESYFESFRKNIVGINAEFETPFGAKKMIYADWIASGRMYAPIEEKMTNVFGAMVGNTHSEASETGVSMTLAYHRAHQIIKKHINANSEDVILTTDSGMTGVINKLQRIMGLKVSEQLTQFAELCPPQNDNRPVVFITHMEHHSNHTSWLETIADVIILEPDEDMLVCSNCLRREITKYANRKLKIGAFSAASNVTGIKPNYYELARVMHENGGYCFIDFAASAPYVDIDMHPENELERLDVVMFSPHKFLGGPGSSGVIVFNKCLYKNTVPDHPGGGTVSWTNRWNEYKYIEDIETREDGGTPGFLQAIRAALCIRLKEEMGVENIRLREEELLTKAFAKMLTIEKLHILAQNHTDRIGVISFYVENVHHNLIVRLMNDRFGVQIRGGCSCAGTYGHYLLHVDKETSNSITKKIDSGDLSEKPGWVRLSIHPTMTDRELEYTLNALETTIKSHEEWVQDYDYCKKAGEYFYKYTKRRKPIDFDNWFTIS